jgi:MFS family permease
MGFFTDAYDLFVIGVASTLITHDWHLDTARLALLNATMLGAAFVGAMVFGRIADLVGRKRVYWLVAAIMAIAAVGSAVSPSFWVLIGFRVLLGLGVGGDYPVSAVLMTEYANVRDRGRLVSLVFSTQALGLIIGPLIALCLLGAGTSTDLTWRLLLGLGALPAATVVYLRRRMPESPRYQQQVRGLDPSADRSFRKFTDGGLDMVAGRAPAGAAGQPTTDPGLNDAGAGVNGAGAGVNGAGAGTNGAGTNGAGTNSAGAGVNGAGAGVNGAGVGVSGAGAGPNGSGADSSGADLTGSASRANGLDLAAGGAVRHQMGLRAFLTSRRLLITLAGTAGCWFLLDYAYYGNTISTPQILKLISPNASIMTTIAIELAIFVVAAVPGYILGIARIDRIGHRRLQLIGFAVMAACFAVIGLVPGMTGAVVPFLLVYGVSYFFTEFGPNMTTFVLPGELFPVSVRATGHGISAGIGKLGAFIGVFLFPFLQASLGLRGTLLLTAALSVAGLALTLVLPEPAGRSLEDISGRLDKITIPAAALARQAAATPAD